VAYGNSKSRRLDDSLFSSTNVSARVSGSARDRRTQYLIGEEGIEEDRLGYDWWGRAWYECCHSRRCPKRLLKEV